MAAVGINTLQEKTKGGGEGGHVEVEQHFSGTNILVLDPGDKQTTVQHKRRNEAKK